MVGLKPLEVFDLELWEFNIYVSTIEEKQKENVVNAILSGYYSSYYINGGKKAKNPNELINKIYARKQDFEEGLRAINKIKEMKK